MVIRPSVRTLAVIGVIAGLAGPACPPASADVRLPHVIGNSMVLQRNVPIRLWGWAEPGEEVTARLLDKQAAGKADAQGLWKLELPAMPAGGPYELEIAGRNRLKLTDVLLGEVWVCSGQSNMAWPVSRAANAAEEIARADFPRIRFFSVPQKLAGEPADDVGGSWVACTPKSVEGFSAVAYFFGREVHRKLDVPVGLINTSWGGTPIEPWTPAAGFAAVPKLTPIRQEIDEAHEAYRAAIERHLDAVQSWLASARQALGARRRLPPMPAWPEHPLVARRGPTTMYNAMVAPLVPLAIRGVLWYQGESNTIPADGMMYFEKMKALIGGWRAEWNCGDFPFYYVQLAPFRYEKHWPAPASGGKRLPEIWEAQRAALSIPNTGMVVTTDIGNIDDIHPANKQEVGRRLALWALAGPYGQKGIVCSGPLYHRFTIEGGRIRIHFTHTGSGLASRDGKPLTWFEIAGDDRRFVEARAEIDGDTVLVAAEQVGHPVAVRFAWSEEANPNLINKEGLPASPFRTDRW